MNGLETIGTILIIIIDAIGIFYFVLLSLAILCYIYKITKMLVKFVRAEIKEIYSDIVDIDIN